MITVLALGGSIAAVSFLGTVVRVNGPKRLDLVDWFVLSFGVINGLGLCLVVWAVYTRVLENSHLASYLNGGLNESLLKFYAPFSLILLSSVWLGAFLANATGSKRSPQWRKGGHYCRGKTTLMPALGWLLLVAGVGLYWLYARPYGGFSGLLNVAYLIRGGLFHSLPENPWSFLKPFGGLTYISSFLFWGLILGRTQRMRVGRVFLWIGLILSTVFSVYVLISRAGRLSFVSYILVFPLSLLLMRAHGRWNIGATIGLVVTLVSAALLLSISDDVLNTGKGASTVTEFMAKELAFPFASFVGQLANLKYRYFKDLVFAPLYFLPERIWSGALGIETASSINTVTLMGAGRGQYGVTGGIPVDIVTLGVMQLGVVGTMITGVILGILLAKIDRLLYNLNTLSAVKWTLYAYAVIRVAAMTTIYADPVHIISRNFHFFIGLICIVAISRDGPKPLFHGRHTSYCHSSSRTGLVVESQV